jgi:tight adherence protein B
MILVVCSAVFAIASLVIVAMRSGPSKPMKQRLEALQREAVAPEFAEAEPDIRREEELSGIGWLNRWMVRLNIAPRIRLLLYQADVKTPAEILLFSSLGGWASLGLLIFFRTGALIASVVISAGFIPVPLIYILRKRASRFAKFEQQLPEALDMLVSALRVGHSLITAIGALGQDATEPIAREFRKLFDEQNFGLDLRTAMNNLAVRVPLQDVRIFVAAALIQKESGGNLAEVLDKVAQTTRDRMRLKKQVKVHTAQGRLTGWILSLMPVALGFAMYLENPGGMSVLWTQPLGLKMLYTAVSMIVIGCLIIRKIVRIQV